MAVISFDFSSVFTWPRTTWFCADHALTMWMNPIPGLRNERRSVFPSSATTPPVVSFATAAIHSRKACSSAVGFRLANTRPRVSCDGIPLGRWRNVFSQSSLASPKSSIATNESAPDRTATSDRTRILASGCSRVRSMRGSGIAAKYCIIEAVLLCSSATWSFMACEWIISKIVSQETLTIRS